jgi:hypothetical protein
MRFFCGLDKLPQALGAFVQKKPQTLSGACGHWHQIKNQA